MALTDSLVSFWAMEEASGTRADSVIGTANDLTDNNTVTQTTGIVGNAAQFTRANVEYLSHADHASLRIANVDHTWNGWVYADSFPSGAASILSKINITREYLLDIPESTQKVRYILWDGLVTIVGIVSSTEVLSTATWYNFNAQFNAATGDISVYVNNGTITSAAKTGDPASSTNGFEIGGRADSVDTEIDGRIDQVGFWLRLLTAEERTFLYNGGAGRTYVQIVAGITVATPSISPNGGSFVVATEVTLSTTTPGATIYYTDDGSVPDNGDIQYTAPFTLLADTTIKAIAYAPAMVTSAVATAIFDIEIPTSTGRLRLLPLMKVGF